MMDTAGDPSEAGKDTARLPGPPETRQLWKIYKRLSTCQDSPPQLRAIDVLERSDWTSARPLLERLAAGVAESRQTSEAQAALERLERRSTRKR
jgi:hypothetical protein